ncbi:MAG: glycosyltransferase [Firmicutes bacterium]|nr:glycosyltransferase [Bacillota bacterium]
MTIRYPINRCITNATIYLSNVRIYFSNVRIYLSYNCYYKPGGRVTFSPQGYSLGILKLTEREIFFVRLLETVKKVQGLQNKNSRLSLNDEQKNILFQFQAKVTSLSPKFCMHLFDLAQKQNLRFFAQFAQDIMAYLFFEGKKDGFYIEVGANDECNGSTIYWAKQLGWKGVHLKNMDFGDFKNKCPDFPEDIDFLLVSMCDKNVLQSIDFDTYSFGLIIIETEKNSNILEFIKKEGYKVLLTAGSSVIFVPECYQIKQTCCLIPFSSINIFIDLLKTALQIMNIEPVTEDNVDAANFIWYQWIEYHYENKNILPQIKRYVARDKKIIWTFHDKIPHFLLGAQNTKDVQKAKEFMKEMAEIADKIIIHCSQTTKLIQELCGENSAVMSKIVYVPHPCYIGAYGFEEKSISLQNDTLKLCLFGAIRKQKNIELLTSTIKELNFDDVELHIIGMRESDEYARYLLDLIGENQKIKTDFRYVDDKEIPNIFANFHLLVQPYNLDSSLNSGATILAFSYGRSVLSAFTGTLADIEDRSLFFTYSYKDEDTHKEELKKQITAIRERYKGNYNELLKLGERCKEYVSENNSFAQVTKQLADVFNVEFASEREELISVLVPVYNTEVRLRRCLDSIVNQTYKNIEIICVNDGSIDDSLQVLNEYAQKDSRIIVVDLSISAYKTAFSCSEGKFIIFVDADDYLEPNYLEILLNAAICNGYDVVCCDYFDTAEKIIGAQFIPQDRLLLAKNCILGFGNAKVVWNKLIKREIYEKVIFHPKIHSVFDDWYILVQILYFANAVGYVHKPLYHCCENPISQTNNPEDKRKFYFERKEGFERIITFYKEKFGNDVSDFEPELSAKMAWIGELNSEKKR